MEFKTIELDENDLGVDVTSNFNQKSVSPLESESDDIEIDVDETPEDNQNPDNTTPKPKVKPEEKLELEVEEPKEKEKEEKQEETPLDYKEVTDYLISTGIFEDFEGKDEFDYSEEGFKELLKEQVTAKAQEAFEGLTEGLSEETIELIEFFKNGGDLATLAKTQEEIQDWESADVSDEDIAESVIRANYSQKGKSKEWITRHITRLKDEGSEAFTAEAEESKTELANSAKELKTRQLEEVKQAKEKRDFQIQQFNQSIAKQINSDTSFTKDSERKKLIEFLSLNKQLKNGNVVNELQIKLYEVQNDPKKYIELGKFLQDIDGYKSKMEKKATTQAAKKTFIKLKDRTSTTQAKSLLPSTSSTVKSKSPFEF